VMAGNGRSVGARFVLQIQIMSALCRHERVLQKFSTIQTLFSPVDTFKAA
jgi:hypothetical protein